MSRYKPYSKYKESEVDWLGEVPEHWEVKKLKFNLQLRTEKVSIEGHTVIALENLDSNTGRYIPTESTYKGEDVACYRNDVLFGKLRPYLAKVYKCNENAIAFGDLLTYRPQKNYKGSYAFYVLISENFIEIVDSSTYGAKMPRASAEFINEMPLPTPPTIEQTTIANFLDHETAKIDTLIDKQQRLIGLLKEKRQAVISHAVTKGLDPNVKMKDSGVEWLGEVPEHWGAKKFKYLFRIKKRIAGQLGYDVLSITQKGIKVKDIESGEGQLSSDYSKYQIVRVGDFAMNHMDLLTGFVDLSKFDGVTSPDYRVFSLVQQNSSSEYYLYLLQMGYLNKLFYPFGQGSSHLGRWRLPTEAFNEFVAPCPPFDEQVRIAEYIEVSLKKFEALTQKANQSITLLKERRTALISAAVTGKIDVREAVA